VRARVADAQLPSEHAEGTRFSLWGKGGLMWLKASYKDHSHSHQLELVLDTFYGLFPTPDQTSSCISPE
jgi:hypothetical protein